MKDKIQLLVKALLPWFAANARDLPWRRTSDPYAIHVSEIMLQQTQVKTVIPYWERWLRELPTVEAASKANSGKLHKLWEGLGYYTRVRNLQKAARMIVARHGGRFPREFADVLALPGIGRYTAGAICSIAFNQPVPILDGNVIRVLTRVFGIAEDPKAKPTNERLWKLAEELVVCAFDNCHQAPSRKATKGNGPSQLNQSLMELGALICTPRNAQCGICPVKRLCAAFREGRVDELPAAARRAPATTRRFAALVIQSHGKYLVRQRPAGVVNAHLWEFPNAEVTGGRGGADGVFLAGFALAASDLSPLLTLQHSITRYRITLEVFKVNVGKGWRAPAGVTWKPPAQMRRLAFASAHRRILPALTRR